MKISNLSAAVVAIFMVATTAVFAQEAQTKKKSKIDRGIEQTTFIKKGTMFFAGSVGYTSLNSKDFKLLVLNDISASAYLMNGKIMMGYAFRDDVAAGVSFDYSRTMASIDNIDLNISSDISFGIKDFYSIQQIYTGTAFLRTYINIGKSKRFGLYNDIKISFGGGQGKVVNGKGETLVGTFQKIQNVGLLLSPGISVFATDFMAIEASIGILGLNYSLTEQISNQVYVGSFETVDASFKLNLFSVALGIAFYF